MTKEEIDTMWQQAMRQSIEEGEMFTRYHFAKLVAAKAEAKEREACAQTCENLPIPNQFSESEGSVWDVAALDCAEAIRARGQA